QPRATGAFTAAASRALSGHRDDDRDHEGDRDEEQATSGPWPPAREGGEGSGEKIAHGPHQRSPNRQKTSPIAHHMDREPSSEADGREEGSRLRNHPKPSRMFRSRGVPGPRRAHSRRERIIETV